MVNYCERWMSAVRRQSSVVCRLLKYIESSWTNGLDPDEQFIHCADVSVVTQYFPIEECSSSGVEC